MKVSWARVGAASGRLGVCLKVEPTGFHGKWHMKQERRGSKDKTTVFDLCEQKHFCTHFNFFPKYPVHLMSLPVRIGADCQIKC